MCFFLTVQTRVKTFITKQKIDVELQKKRIVSLGVFSNVVQSVIELNSSTVVNKVLIVQYFQFDGVVLQHLNAL